MTAKTRTAPVPVSERMRLYRERRRQGVRLIRFPLHVTNIDELIQFGLLKQDQRQEEEALRAAVLVLFRRALDRALEEAGDGWAPPWAREE
jgi:hypothetical protein